MKKINRRRRRRKRKKKKKRSKGDLPQHSCHTEIAGELLKHTLQRAFRNVRLLQCADVHKCK
jgi:hypothetical protein